MKNKHKHHDNNNWLFAATILPLCFLLYILVEITYRLDANAVFRWLGANGGAVFLGFLVVFALTLFFLAVCGNLFVALSLSSLICFLVSLVNHFKYSVLAENFVPLDLFKAELAARFTNTVAPTFPPPFWVPIVIWIVALTLAYVMLPSLWLTWLQRGIVLVVSVLLLLFLLTASGFKLLILSNMGIQYDTLNPDYTYSNNGLIFGFTLHTRSALLTKPDGYDSLIPNFRQFALAAPKIKPQQPPQNIIFVLSESFWDPTLLEGLQLDIDPLENYRRLAKRFPSGELIVPSFGGATINVEFEALTGLSTFSLPRGAYPFLQYMNSDIYSVAWALKDEDYRTIGVHTYDKTFYNRNEVYPMLGFDEFYGAEDSLLYDVSGGYLSDELLSQMILDLVNDNTEDGTSVRPPSSFTRKKRKKFIFAISMENHLPYKEEKYKEYPFNIASEGLSDENLSALKSYVMGTHKADLALKSLVNGLSKVKDPTLLVFFGDHLPPFGNQEIYLEHDFIAEERQLNWTHQERLKTHKTPLLIWANYPLKQEELTVGASFLPSVVMRDYIGITDNTYFNGINNLFTDYFTAINNSLLVDKDGKIYAAVPNELKTAADFYASVCYNALFDKSTLIKELNK